mgnify:CR=1 FL=1
MPMVEIEIPDEVRSELEHLVDEEFMNQEEAIEQLLREGLRTYTREFDEPEATDLSEEYASNMWDTAEGTPTDEGDDYTL